MSKWESKEKRVEDIVSSAIEVFLEKGYDGASMEAIAKKAQMSKGGLYHHFGSKDEILYYANEKLCSPVNEYIKVAENNTDAVEGIRSYIRNYMEHWVNHQKELTFFFLTMTKALASKDMWSIYEDYFNMIKGFLTGLFVRGILEGKLVEHDSEASAVTLMAAMDGILVYLITNSNMKLDDVIRQFEEKFVNSLFK